MKDGRPETVTDLLGMPVCTNCRKLQMPEIPMMNVQTHDRLHTFCYSCVRKSVGMLSRKPLKTMAEIDLLVHLRRYLRSIPRS